MSAATPAQVVIATTKGVVVAAVEAVVADRGTGDRGATDRGKPDSGTPDSDALDSGKPLSSTLEGDSGPAHATALRVTAHGLRERRVTAVIAREGVILAGTTEGVYRSDDAGATWRPSSTGIEPGLRHIRALAFHPEVSDLEMAGSEPAAILRSQDGAATWSARPEVAQLRADHGWWLPYSPRDGCVRAFAARGTSMWAAVEVGGLLRSLDHGQSWRLIAGGDGAPATAEGRSLHADVHAVFAPSDRPGLLWAPTGGGLHRSEDDGETWRRVHPRYTRAAWVDPANPEHLLLSHAAGSNGRDGALEETFDGGATWKASSGSRETTWGARLAERFALLPTAESGSLSLLAVRSDGALMAGRRGPEGDWSWARVLREAGYVTDVFRAE